MAVRRKPFGPKRPRDRELIVRDTYPPSSRAPKKPSGNTSKLYKGIFGRTKKDRKIPAKPVSPTSLFASSTSDGWVNEKTKAPYSGPYFQHTDGKFYTGKKYNSGGFFRRRRNTEIVKLPKPKPVGKPKPKPRDRIDTPSFTGGGASKYRPSRGGGKLAVEIAPYKPLDTYINQYPAEESSVAPAKEEINPSYTPSGLKGHFNNTAPTPGLAVSFEGTPPSLSQVRYVLGTYMNFILEWDGDFITSFQYHQKLKRAAGENNPYFRIDRNAVPIISMNTSNPNFSTYSEQFKKEDDYAMVDVDYKLAIKDIWIRHIDYITRKTSVNQGVRTPSQIYQMGANPWTVRDTASDGDAIIASAGKAPKVRFKGETQPTVEAKVTSTPKKKKKIICNELYQQGYLPEHIWDADERWGDKTFITDPKLVIGYQMWARKVVEFMRKKPQYTPAIYFLCKPWTEWMAYDLGVLPKNNLKGQLTQFVGRYFSYAVYDLFGGDKLYKRYHKLT